MQAEIPHAHVHGSPQMTIRELGREPMNSEWSADVRFGAHSGLKSDITALPKSACQ
jgi:hypothetical protein